MLPVADPERLMRVPGAEVAAVVPLNLFVPIAIFPATDTSFQGSWLFDIRIWVKLPETDPDPKFTEIDGVPEAYAS